MEDNTTIIEFKHTSFNKWGDLNKEFIGKEDVSTCLYKKEEEDEEPKPISFDHNNECFQLIKNMGFKRKGGLGICEKGMREPIIL